MDIHPTPVHRRIQSFVRREGRLTDGQRKALDALLPTLEIPAGDSTLDGAALFGRDAPIGLEIGFGSGHHLHQLAKIRPDWNFIGLEVYRPGVGRLLQALAADQLGNVRVALEDAQRFLHARIAPGALDAVYIQFPDPWPKKRHHKRRLVQPDFARMLAERLRPAGELQLATDWADYAGHILDVLEKTPGLVNAAGPGRFSERPPNRIPTRFEQRGERLGHAVFDLVYRKVS